MTVIFQESIWELHVKISISLTLCYVYESVESDLTNVGCDNSILICVPIHVILALNDSELQSTIHSHSEFVQPRLCHWHDSLLLLDQNLAEGCTQFSCNKFHFQAMVNTFVTAGSIFLLSQFYLGNETVEEIGHRKSGSCLGQFAGSLTKPRTSVLCESSFSVMFHRTVVACEINLSECNCLDAWHNKKRSSFSFWLCMLVVELLAVKRSTNLGASNTTLILCFQVIDE